MIDAVNTSSRPNYRLREKVKMATQRTFLKEYIKAIRDGNAAVFAGAGLSRPSGFVDWKELLRPLAEEIGLRETMMKQNTRFIWQTPVC